MFGRLLLKETRNKSLTINDEPTTLAVHTLLADVIIYTDKLMTYKRVIKSLRQN